MESSRPRAPLKELQNIQTDNRPSQANLKKTGINRKSMIQKPSALPLAPSRRQTTTRVTRAATADPPPPPSRVTAKPKRAATTVMRGTSRAPANSETTRRSAASMSFTHGSATSRTGLSSRRSPPGEAVNASEMTHKMDSIHSELGQLKDVINSKHGANSRSPVDDKMVQVFETMLNKISSSQSERDAKLLTQVAETAQLRATMSELQDKLSKADGLLTQEKARSNALEEEVSELQANIDCLTKSLEDTSRVSNEDFDALRKQFAESQTRVEKLAAEKCSLEDEVAVKREQLAKREHEFQQSASDLKEALMKADRVQTDLSCRESELRRIKREKEEAQAERIDLEETLKKRTSSLHDERRTVDDLRSEIESVKASGDKAVKDAAHKYEAYEKEMAPQLHALRKERDEIRLSFETTSRDLEARLHEVTSLSKMVSLQESKISKLDIEKRSDDLRLEALNEDLATSSKEIEQLKQTIENQREEIDGLERQAREDQQVQRKLRNDIQELKGNIRVFARVRPLLKDEQSTSDPTLACEMFEYTGKGQGLTAKCPMPDGRDGPTSSKKSRYPFTFDRVFDPQSSQDSVFEEISQLVQSALDGYRVCIFAYGQTGSGKTHTMIGNPGEDGANLGMIPRSVRQVFDTAQSMEKDDWSFTLKASFLEIYNETVRDLLSDSSPVTKRSKEQKAKDEPYKIHFHNETRLSTVSDLTVELVKSEEQLHRLIDKSMKKRATAATKANERSSRSHSVFRLHIEGRNAFTGEKRTGLLNLIDLAGSERLSHSKAEGERLRETRNINKSLSALGDVISALANKDKHIPFRNSKLTHLLQDSLGGESKTLMFVNISHAPDSFHESLTSLRFAAKVNSCHVGTAKRSAKMEV